MCLTSLQVNERIGGFNPSVIFQGKVMHRIGPISHTAGETPHYAQLYVLDSDMESTQRFANMNVPASLSRNQRNVLKQVLEIVQRCLHDVNPFIHDFKQIMEIPGSDLANGKIVISAKGKDTLISCQHFYIFAYIDIYLQVQQTHMKEDTICRQT